MVERVERHVMRSSSALDPICHKAKKLYNYAHDLFRQRFFANQALPITKFSLQFLTDWYRKHGLVVMR